MKSRRPGFGVLCAAVALGAACLWPAAAAAQERYTRAEEDEFHRAATRALAHGEYDEARTLAEERDAADPSSSALLARLDVLRGEYEAAEARLAPVAEANPVSAAGLELALLQQYLGRRDEAAVRFRVLVDRLQRSPDAVDLYRAAQAARALGRYRQANALLRNAAGIAPDDPAIQTLWGELFGEKYDQAEASQSYIAALEIDEEWAPALLGMARALADTNPPAASASADRALEIDPDYLEAHLFAAQRSFDDRDHEAGRASLERAFAINGRSLEARSLRAAVAYVEDRLDDFEAEVQRVLEFNPTYGEVYRVAGNLTARNYRFEEAAALVRRGLAIDPANTRAYAELGMHLLRTGDEAGARLALERSFGDDPYDVITFNLLEMLDTLDGFETFEEGDLIVRLHPDEAPVLKDYVIDLGQRALDELSVRYGMEPEGPILIEVFPQHDHFAVRTLGLPGMIGALGACFGRVVTLDSPRARSPGDFNWQATLWHEMAHVIALQLSNQRVPRWLTEGLSVYEEKRLRADWARDQDLEFATDLNRGDVLSLRDLNSGFSRPDKISISYFQASVLVEHMMDEYGESTVYDLLRAYGDGLDTEAALDRVGLSFDTLQASFDVYLEVRFGALRRAMEDPEQPDPGTSGALVRRLGDPDGPPSPGAPGRELEGEPRLERLRELGEEHPGSYPVQMSLGHALWADGDLEAARAAFERAAALAPMATGDGSADLPLAAIALEQEDRERAMGHLEAHLDHDHRALDAARRLAVLAEEAGDDRRRRRAYELVTALDPFDAEPHQSLGRLAMAAGDTATAVREFSVALAAGPIDRVSAHVDLADSHLAAGDMDAARRQVIAALEIAPTYERAQEMLLDIVEAGL